MFAKLTRIAKQRQSMLAALVAISMAALLVVGTMAALKLARLHDAKHTLHTSAVAIAQQLVSTMPDIETAFAQQRLAPLQRITLRNIASNGQLVSLALITGDGQKILSDGLGPLDYFNGEIPEIVPRVFESRRAQTVILANQSEAEADMIWAATIVPVVSANDEVIGLVKLVVNQAMPAASLSTLAGLVAIGIPIICSFAFLIPALIMIRISQTARAREADLSASILHDGLTGLMNRNAITAKLRYLFENRRDPAEQTGIIMIDLDNFKAVNDLHSMAVGDIYLRTTAMRLQEVIGSAGMIARTNNDEFMLVLPTITQEALDRTAEDLYAAISAPVIAEKQAIICTASIGVHLSPFEQALDRAVHAADLALKQAILNGKNRIVAYDEAFDAISTRNNMIESFLRQIDIAEHLDVCFQPFVDSQTGQVVGFEALSRLSDADGVPISPEDFIPVAEGSGLIHEIGLVALRKALRAARQWPRDMFVSVNLSPVQFQDPDLATKVMRELRQSGLRAQRLELELTESMLLSKDDSVRKTLKKFHKAGIRMAIDDFGTGYSSLGYFWKYDFDKIKIDKSFLYGQETDQTRTFDIIETIIDLGHKLGMSVTIEGIENAVQVDVLTAMECDYFQGYYFSRPLTQSQALAVVRSLDEHDAKSA